MLETVATFEYCNSPPAILMSPAQKPIPVPDGFLSLSSSLHPSPSSLSPLTMTQQVRTESRVSSLSVGALLAHQLQHPGKVRCGVSSGQWSLLLLDRRKTETGDPSVSSPSNFRTTQLKWIQCSNTESIISCQNQVPTLPTIQPDC